MTAFLMLLSCDKLIETSCGRASREIGDDEQLDLGFSVNEALLHIDPQTFDARDLLGTPVSIEVSLTRGEGTAHLDDGTMINHVVRQGGPNSDTTFRGAPNCLDELAVPVSLTLEGETVSVATAATLTNDPVMLEPQFFYVVGTLDFEADTVPAGLHGTPVSGEVSMIYIDGNVFQLEANVVTNDGAQETVLWYRAPQP